NDYFDTVTRIKTLKSEIEAIKAGSKTGELASLEAELTELQQKRDSLAAAAEKVITRQMKDILSQQAIYNPLDKYVRLKVNFPPLDFKLEKPPHLLVISPREKIESMREIVLQQEITTEEMEQIEREVDKLGVSSIVVKLGGFGGTYPAFVTNEASLRFTVDAAAEEWLHQYLFFQPLGFRYAMDVLGVKRNYEIATMNETVASMAGKEIGERVVENYYPDLSADKKQDKKSGFDFDNEMRVIRRAVDEYLAQGEVERAEEFMEEKRQYLVSKGYHIRKLNQAYFAFHGAYADRPTSISPIGGEIERLREQSASLKDFLMTVSSMTSREDLLESLK
ncbi:MAG: hypothetical protein HQ577_06280, partial [Dehalococcoidia bacterium]|nr:hypothetical protein [Dehalococcoidia bacterium]